MQALAERFTDVRSARRRGREAAHLLHTSVTVPGVASVELVAASDPLHLLVALHDLEEREREVTLYDTRADEGQRVEGSSCSVSRVGRAESRCREAVGDELTGTPSMTLTSN